MNVLRKTISKTTAGVVLLGVLFFCYVAIAQPERPQPVIGVVNIEKVLEPAIQSLKEQVETLLKNYHHEFSGYEENLRIESQALLESQKKIQPQDKIAKRTWEAQRRNFEKRTLEIQKKAESRRKALGEAHGEMMNTLQGLLAEVIQEVGDAKNIIILSQTQVIYWKPCLDLTEEVSRKLKERMPDVTLVIKEATNA
jgi:Skp family chaperone for outer membrane proteins